MQSKKKVKKIMIYPWFKPDSVKNDQLIEVKKMINQKNLTMGNKVDKLEKKLQKILKVKNIILTTSGTSALFLASIAANINNKKLTYLSNLNWVATANPPKFLGSKLTLIDTSLKSEIVDFKKLNRHIRLKKPDVVFITHLNGEPAVNREFLKLKKKKKFMVIEDCAQAFMVKANKKNYCGTSFDIGCFSLSITKLSNMIYGGFCSTNNDKLAKKMRTIRNNGVSAAPENAWLQTSSEVGLNLKPSNLHAIFGLHNLKRLKKNISIVKRIHKYYSTYLKNKNFVFLKKNTQKTIPIYNYLEVKNRKKFINFCKKNKIGIHLGIRCLHQNKPFKQGYRNFPNSSFFSNHMVRIPSGPGYKLSEIKKICNLLNKYND